MKNLFVLILLTFLLSSCQKYGSSISAPFTSQQCPFRVLDQATRDSAAKGWVVIDSSHAGNPSICGVKYVIQPSWLQRYSIAKRNGTIIWFYVFISVGISLIVFGIKNGNNPSPKQKSLPIALFIAAILFLAAAAGVVEWAHGKEAEISKAVYDAGDLKTFWDENLYK